MTPKAANKKPHLLHERALWANGALWIAGVDEAGRGALAGPVAAAAVVLPQINNFTRDLAGVRDSKLMSTAQREQWAQLIRQRAVTWGLGLASPQEIDQIGILPATQLAASRALAQLAVTPDHLLLDYLQLPKNNTPQTSIPKGDLVSLSIAAASVLAKTSRDAILCQLDSSYPGFGFATHKGYGTATHLAAIEKLGPTDVHRMSFGPLQKWTYKNG